MKKTYNAPATKIVKIQSVQMIAESLSYDGNAKENGITVADVHTDNGWDIWGRDEADYDDYDD